MRLWSSCGGNFPLNVGTRGRTAVLKSNLHFSSAFLNKALYLEQAGSELEKIVAQSLRQAPPAQAPLMAWPVVCGSAVAERTQALSFDKGVLRVAVPDAGWKLELQMLAPRYVAVINRYTVETVCRIEFVVLRPETPVKNSR